jgi:hypothetical protein
LFFFFFDLDIDPVFFVSQRPTCSLRRSSETPRGLECINGSYKLTYHYGSQDLSLLARTWLRRCDELCNHMNSPTTDLWSEQGSFCECLESCPDGTRERLFRPTRAHVALRHKPHLVAWVASCIINQLERSACA